MCATPVGQAVIATIFFTPLLSELLLLTLLLSSWLTAPLLALAAVSSCALLIALSNQACGFSVQSAIAPWYTLLPIKRVVSISLLLAIITTSAAAISSVDNTSTGNTVDWHSIDALIFNFALACFNKPATIILFATPLGHAVTIAIFFIFNP